MSIQIKRICSLVMALIMVCGLIPATAFEAAAVEATTPTVEEISNTAVSTNVEDAICPCGCGRKVTEIPEDEWQEWVFNTRLETGHYRLTESKTGVTRTLISETGKVLLNLNGYDITTGSGYRGITIYTGGVATLIGEGTISGYAAGAGVIEIGAGSTFNLYQAEIKNLNTDSSKKVAGTAVTLSNGTSASARTQFNMYSGALVGGKIYSTGSIRVGTYCTFNMYGGTLTAGAASGNNGNGVYMTASSSVFNLAGGTLIGTGNANRGGAVYMAGGTFTMSDGKITGFGAGRGAGVFVAAGTFNMEGGEISGNTATSTGMAVDVYGTSAVFTMTGGTVTSGVTAGVGTIHSLSPNVHISGGVVNGNICSTESITVSGAVKIADVDLVTADKDGKAVATSLIVGEAGLKDGASIGITANDGQQVFAEGTDANVAQYLYSTAAGRNEFVYDNGTLTLIENNYCPVCKQNVTWAEWTNGLTVGGHYYLDKDVTVGSQWTVGQNADPAEYCLDLNGHSFNKGGRAFNIYGGSTANVFSTGFNSQIIGAYVADNAGVINLADNSNMNLYDGLTLIGNAADNGFAGNSGGVIQVNSGTFNMYGSTIIGQKAENGGAVIVNATGTFNMYGGLIKDGIAGHGGNIAVNGGTANISGGIIEGGYTDGDTYGGGNIYVQNSGNVTISGNAVIRDGYSKAKSSDTHRGGGNIYVHSGTLTVNGGTIENGGTNACGGNIFSRGGSVIINGGNILNGKAGVDGGNIAVRDNTVSISGGTITGGDVAIIRDGVNSFTVSGAPTIEHLALDVANSGVDTTITLGEGGVTGGSIAVSAAEGAFAAASESAAASAAFFTSVNDELQIAVTEEGQLALAAAHTHEWVEHAAVESTCDTEGNVAYKQCSGCGEAWTLGENPIPLSKDGWILGAKGHTWVDATYEAPKTCSVCGATEGEPLIKVLEGSGTEEAPYLIKDLSDLILFRDSVNAGETTYNAAGIYVALAADIDMSGTDWSVNIGDDCNATFDGIFDGKGHTIKNLTATETAQKADGYICTGLFGAIYGSAQIKNLTLENVTINAEYKGNNVGAVVGFAYACTDAVIENVHVIGNININAPKAYGVGAIVGYAYYGNSLTIKDCSVEATTDSAIIASSASTGIIGYSSSYGLNVTGCAVKNIALNATAIAGGLAGVVTGGTFSGNTVENVTITVTGENWKNSAAIAVGTLASTTVTVADTTYSNVNVNGIVGSQYAEQPTTPVAQIPAKIGNIYYYDFNGALKAAKAGETITLLCDMALVEGIVIAADKEITLDLNGKTISLEDASGKASALITNKGNLTIDDSIGGGKLSFITTTPGGTSYASNTISNNGVLTIKAGTIENLSDGPACYALDNYAGSTATIEGGKLYAEKTCVRIFNWSATNATLNVIGGEIVANIGYGINVNMGNTPDVTLNISGGSVSTIANSYNLAVYVIVNTGSDAYTAENVKVNITGGTFGGAVALNGKTASTMAPGNVSISGGIMDEVICYADPAYGFVSGGTFGSAVAAEYLVNGFDCVENENGSYGVAPHIHTWVDVAAVEATCNAEGNIAYQYCSVCGAAQTAGENPMPLAKFGWILGPTGEHTFEHHDAVAATCDTDGHEAFDYCTTCECFFYADPLKLTYQAGIILALGHTWVEHAEVKPTCDAQGNIAYAQCSVCGAAQTLGEEPIPLSKDGWILAATGEHTYENGICTECGAEDPNYVPPVEDKEITFELGANGSASHNDGTEFTTKTFTEGDYTLKLTGGSKAYAGARDAKGNSCIKLGTGKLIGKFSFEVPEDVSEVVIYAAKYKTNGSKLKINGTTYTLSGASNNGAYDEIVIDTSETKTVTVETVSGALRAMINTIVFRVKAPAAPDNSSKLTTNIGGITFIVGQAQEFEFTTIANENAGVMVIGTSNFSDASAIEKLEYYEVSNGQWYELSGDFGPATGFPMSDATSKFRVTFAKAGKYTFTAEMKNAETGEVLCSVEATANVNDPDGKELTIAEAIAKGKAMAHNEYTETKYTVTGVITEVYNTQYGNMKLTDENGNILTIYGTYSADGKLSYSAMSVKPVAGDTVTIYGVIGQYNGTAQIKNGWIIEHIIPHVHDWVEHEAVDPTCDTDGNVAYKQCSGCGEAWTLGENPIPLSKDGWILGATGHDWVEHEAVEPTCYLPGNIAYAQCSVCGAAQTLGENPMPLAKDGWILGVKHTIIHVEAVAATFEATGNVEYWYCQDCGYAWLDEGLTLVTNLKSVITPALVAAELTTNIDELNFIAGEAMEFQFSTIANDHAGVLVIGSSNFSDASAIEKLEYYEVSNGQWYELSGDFGPASGFPMSDATSLFRVTFAKSGEYTFTASMKNAENGEIICSVEATAKVAAPAELTTNIGELNFVAGEAMEFQFSTIANGHAGVLVIGSSNFSDASAIEKLEYYEVSNGQWYELSGDFGPASGFPMSDATSLFRVTFAKGGEYTFTASMKNAETGAIICSVEATANVHEHSWVEHAAVEPTCDTEGNVAYKQCSGCGEAWTLGEEPLPLSKDGWILGAKGHTWVEHEEVKPTCDAQGNIAYAQCSVCGAAQTLGEEPIPLSKDGWILAATGEHTYENGICTECGAEDPNYVPPVEDKEITFEFGANGSASHNDGTEFTTKTFTEGDYTLKLTGGSKAYAGARDAKGNSCIKLGTSKLIGKFSFEVPEDVSEVVIYAAKYKTNGSKLKINGTTYTLSGASNNGAYDEIVIDTSETKTVTVETVSGALRAMINTIVFRVKAPAAPDNSSKLTTNIGGITFIVGQAQEFEFTTIANENAGVMVIGTSNFSDASAIEKLEYYETANGQWYELSGDFGPATGFPMSDATSKFRVTFAKAGKYTFTAEMKNAETGEVLCSVEATANVNDPDGKELTIAEAIAKGKAMAHNEYTETKYTVTGVITEVYNTQYGNMKLTDENGNILTIYGTYSADGKLSYSTMSIKPVAGDTVTIYGVIGQYNGTAQIKNGWIIEHIIPEPEETEHVHDWVEYEAVEPTCELPGNIAYKQCSECGEAWTLGENPMPLSKDGWILGVKHTIIHVEAKAATLEAEGNVEYWYCEDCGYAWLDEGMTLVTNLMSVILPKLEPEVTDPTEPSVPEETEPASSATYIFADYKIDGELGGSACFRELDETVRVDISAGWFTTEARIYKNANLVISSKVAMESIVLNVGYKNSTFNVYVSEDGETWTEYQMGVTYTTAYSDISIELPVDCKYVKIDAPNAQVRIKTMTVNFAAQGSEPTEPTEPEHEHTWVEYAAVEPSCNAEGNIAYKQCSDCGEAWSLGEEPMPLSKDGWILGPTGKHTFEHHDAVPATCDTDGHEAFDYCTTCQCFFYADPLKLTYQAGIILALGHTWIDVAAVEPTCDTEGNIAYQYCEVCGAAQTAGENPMPLSKGGWILGAKGHTWVEHEAVEPTCYLPGNIAYAQCSVCGAAQTAGENPMPLGKDGWILGVKHNIIHVEAKAATVKAEGNVEYWYCEDCGYAWLDEGLTLVTNLMSVILPKLEPVHGDLNADQEVNNDDVLALLWSNLFPEDFAIEGEADFNGDTIVDNNDVLKLLWFTLFPENYPL